MLNKAMRKSRCGRFIVLLLLGMFLTLVYVYGPQYLPRLGEMTFGRDDTLSFLWIFHRLSDNLFFGTRPLFDGGIFYPNTESLAFSEIAFLCSVIYRGFYVFSHDLLLSFNLTIALLMGLNFACMYVFCRNFVGRTASFAGAFLFTFSMIRLSRLPQCHLLPQFPVPLIAHYLWRFENTGAPRALYAAATWFALQFYFSLSLGMIAMMGFLFYLPIRCWFKRKERPNFLPFVLALVIAGGLLAPLGLKFFSIRAKYQTVRTIDEAGWNSAYLTHYLLVPQGHPYDPILGNRKLFQRALSLRHEKILFLGFAGIFFFGLGFRNLRMVKNRPTRFWVAWIIVTLLFIFWISLGPQARLYNLFYYWFPGMQGIRTPARFGLFYLFLGSLLVSLGVQYFLERPRKKVWVCFGVAALFGLAIWENHLPSRFVTPPDNLNEVSRWLGTRPVEEPVIFIPLYFDEENRGYAQLLHQHPIANGYSGFFPPSYHALKALLEKPLDKNTIEGMRDYGFRYLVIQGEGLQEEARAEWARLLDSLHVPLVFATPNQQIYRLN